MMKLLLVVVVVVAVLPLRRLLLLTLLNALMPFASVRLKEDSSSAMTSRTKSALPTSSGKKSLNVSTTAIQRARGPICN